MKLKFEEAISVPDAEKRSIADTIDYHTVGVSQCISVTSIIISSYSQF